ncbi:MAG: electron transport complex subunit RsxC [Rikenellaceae bacterium]|jgi:electron transport complex protein RnfC|nr:electron transport complex subunit RsxC [Rikenellaceae bacterium]
MKTFSKGGIHPPENKLGAGEAIRTLPLPETVTVPLSQHIGAPAVAVVAKGDKVLTGQLIAKSGGFVSAGVHSPVSGVVTAVDDIVGPAGLRQAAITIKVEGDEWMPEIDRSEKLAKGCPFEADEIIKRIAEAGIVGMGGATFPTQVKLTPPPGKKAEYLIINGVECEPYLTADHRVMLERGMEVLTGASILAKALKVAKTFVGIESNKPDAIAHLTKLASNFLAMEVVPLRVKYPQGGEKQLIEAVVGRQVPSGALPIDVGVVVQNVGTALAVYEAVQKNKPLIERVVSVTGHGIATPANFLARIGTPVSALIEAAGGVTTTASKVIGGGPMMGRAMSNVGAPVTKGTSGILVMNEREASRCAETGCIKCGRCVTACPMGLEPYLLSKQAEKQMFDELEAGHVYDCIECGSCAFTCPARVPLLDWIRQGKAGVMKIMRSRTAPAK